MKPSSSKITEPAKAFTDFISYLNLRTNEIKIYNLLTKKPMTIKELIRELRVSERTLRTYLFDLLKKGFVYKKVIEDRRLKYQYYAKSPVELMKFIRRQVSMVLSKMK